MTARRRDRRRTSAPIVVQPEIALARGAPKAPLLPHEHDESPEPSSASPQPVVLQAHVDLTRGLVDTDRRQDATRIFNNHPRNKGRPSGP